jgi:ParB family chromosome partitioning protein
MNTVTISETQALEAAVPAQAMLLVALAKLRFSKRNVRKTGGTPVVELAASIERVGLLQILTVIACADGEHHEVVAGGRRLAALKLLAKQKRLPKDYPVPCLLVADASARTASLTENVQREPMHSADQFEAFAALVAEGRSIEDIAADFGVTPLVVQRRLKLACLAATIAGLPDRCGVAGAPDGARDHQRPCGAGSCALRQPGMAAQPQALHEHLTHEEIEAGQDALTRCVGAAPGSNRGNA